MILTISKLKDVHGTGEDRDKKKKVAAGVRK